MEIDIVMQRVYIMESQLTNVTRKPGSCSQLRFRGNMYPFEGTNVGTILKTPRIYCCEFLKTGVVVCVPSELTLQKLRSSNTEKIHMLTSYPTCNSMDMCVPSCLFVCVSPSIRVLKNFKGLVVTEEEYQQT